MLAHNGPAIWGGCVTRPVLTVASGREHRLNPGTLAPPAGGSRCKPACRLPAGRQGRQESKKCDNLSRDLGKQLTHIVRVRLRFFFSMNLWFETDPFPFFQLVSSCFACSSCFKYSKIKRILSSCSMSFFSSDSSFLSISLCDSSSARHFGKDSHNLNVYKDCSVTVENTGKHCNTLFCKYIWRSSKSHFVIIGYHNL